MVLAVSLLFEELEDLEDYVTVQTFPERFDRHPHTSPYFTVLLNREGQYEAEIAGNISLQPKLSVNEYDRMVELGWAKPRAGKDEDYGDFPNFSKVFPEYTHSITVATDIFEALVTVYGMKATDEIAVGSERRAELIDSMKLLHRLEPEEWNPQRKLFKLKEGLE